MLNDLNESFGGSDSDSGNEALAPVEPEVCIFL